MNFDHFLRFASFCQAVLCVLRDLVGVFSLLGENQCQF